MDNIPAIEVIDNTSWDKYLSKANQSSPFQTYAWSKGIERILGGKFMPVYAVIGQRSWLIPCYLGSPWATNDELRIGSIGYGGPLPIHEIEDISGEYIAIQDVLNGLSLKFNCSQVMATLYPRPGWGELNDRGLSLSETVIVPLSSTIETIFTLTLTGNTRTAIRKATKEGVVIREVNTENIEECERAYKILRDTQVSVGSNYTTNRDLFFALARGETLGLTKVFISVVHDTITGVAVLVWNEHEAFHLFHGWDKAFAYSCANQALIWHMMKYAHELNVPVFNMGESHSDSLLAAKLRWGGRTVPVARMSKRYTR
jgi:hypothetical protein